MNTTTRRTKAQMLADARADVERLTVAIARAQAARNYPYYEKRDLNRAEATIERLTK